MLEIFDVMMSDCIEGTKIRIVMSSLILPGMERVIVPDARRKLRIELRMLLSALKITTSVSAFYMGWKKLGTNLSSR